MDQIRSVTEMDQSEISLNAIIPTLGSLLDPTVHFMILYEPQLALHTFLIIIREVMWIKYSTFLSLWSFACYSTLKRIIK